MTGAVPVQKTGQSVMHLGTTHREGSETVILTSCGRRMTMGSSGGTYPIESWPRLRNRCGQCEKAKGMTNG